MSRGFGFGCRQQLLADAHAGRGVRNGDRAKMRDRGAPPPQDHGVSDHLVRRFGDQEADRRRSDGMPKRPALQAVDLEHRMFEREQRIDIRRFGRSDDQIRARLGRIATHAAVHG